MSPQHPHRSQISHAPVFERTTIAAAVSLSLLLSLSSVAQAAPAASAPNAAQPAMAKKNYQIAAGPLEKVLKTFSAQAGIKLEIDEAQLHGLSSAGLSGQYTINEALAALLNNHDLTAKPQDDGYYAVTIPQASQDGQTLPSVVVYGRSAYAGGQRAADSRVGLLGDKHFMDTPFNTVSYTENYIENQQAQDIGSAMAATDPSIFSPSKKSVLETLFIRGLYTSANDFTFNGLIGMAPNNRSSTEMAARIEVLKGPSALLNGMPPDGSLGGSVNIVPKRAGNEPLAKISASYDSSSLAGVHVDVGRRFGAEKQWGVRFNGVLRDGDTPVDRQKNRMGLAAFGLDWRGERGRLSLDLYKLNERLDGVNYFGIFGIAKPVTVLPSPKRGDYSLAPDWSFTDVDSTVALLRGSYDLTDSLSAFAAYGERHGGGDALISRNTLLNNAGDISVMLSRYQREGTQKSGEIGLRGDFETAGIEHAWSLAATQYTSRQDFKDLYLFDYAKVNYYDLNFGPAPDVSGFGAVTSRTRAKLDSIALLDTLSFLQGKVQWTIGARRQGVHSSSYTAAGMQTSTYDESRISPSTALLFKLSNQLSLYANYIEGLSQGGTAPETAQNAGEILKPYQTRQYEIGLKQDFGQFAHTLSLFQIAKPNAYTDPVSNIYGVYGEQRNRGIEWSVFGTLQPGLRLQGGASYTRAELTRTLNPANQGHQATGVPKIMAKLGAEYDIAGLPGLTVIGNANHVGERYVADDNRLALPSFTTFDIGARYTAKIAAKEVTLRATVQNVANRAYWLGSWQGGDGSGLSGGLGAPRALLLSGSVAF